MNWDLVGDVQKRMKQLTPEEQLYVISCASMEIANQHFSNPQRQRDDDELCMKDPATHELVQACRLPYADPADHGEMLSGRRAAS